jgi:hypothetical protein
MTTAQEFIKKEMDLRVKLVHNPNFIKACIEVAKKIGITANEWNNNKAAILLFMANEAISKDNKTDFQIREWLNN